MSDENNTIRESEITSFFHCRECIKCKPPTISPREWAQNEVGFTRRGIQVWCKRHEINVCHIDFEGQQHPAVLDKDGTFE